MDNEIKTLGEVMPGKQLARIIRDSATAVLTAACEREGIALTAAQIATLAREIGNNAGGLLAITEIE